MEILNTINKATSSTWKMPSVTANTAKASPTLSGPMLATSVNQPQLQQPQPTIEPAPKKVTPVVQTSNLAGSNQDQTANFLNWAKDNMTSQQYNVATAATKNNMTAEQMKEAERLAKLEQQKLDNETAKVNALTGKETKTTADTYEDPIARKQRLLDEEADTQMNEFRNLTQKMLDGTFPLNPLQQAQLDGLRKNYESLITAQKEANKQYEGAMTQSGITSGRSRYAPEIEAGNIFNAVQTGINAVAELESKMASSLAQMEAGFQEDNYALIQSSYKTFTDAQDKKQKQLDKMYDEMAEALKATNKVNETIAKEFRDTKASYLETLSQNGAPAELIAAANQANNVTDLYALGGSYAVKGSGIIGEYNLYSAMEMEQGNTPMSFRAYQNEDANRKIQAASAAANNGGLTTAQSSLVNSQNTFLASQPIAKDLMQIQSHYMDLIKNVGKGSGPADMAMIFQLMKALDPSSVVRESEYKTGVDKSGNLFAGKLAYLNSYINKKGGFLSEQGKMNILEVINTAYTNRIRQYQNVRNQVVDRLERQGIMGAENYVVDFDMSTSMYDEQLFTEKDLGLYLKMNPHKEATALQVMKDNPHLSDYEIWQIVESL